MNTFQSINSIDTTGTSTVLIGMASAAAVAGWYAFRRRDALNVDETGKKIASIDPSLSISARPVLSKNDRNELKRAFLRGQDFKWMITGWTDDGKNDAEFKKNARAVREHRELTFYMLECVIRFAEEYGYTIVSRDPKTGEYRGSLLLIPPYSSASMFNLHFMRCVVPLGNPVFKTLEDPAASSRATTWADSFPEAHCEVMDSFRKSHWYVLNLGVAESAQGKGVGKALMNAAKQIAGDLPLYLECHDDNIPIYERMGFINEKQMHFEPKEEGKQTHNMNIMVFYPNKK